MMISPKDRFWAVAEIIWGDVHRGYIIDWDQGRWYLVCGPKKLLPPEKEEEIRILKFYINYLPHKVHSINVDGNGSIVSVSANPEDDPTSIPYCPRYPEIATLQDCPTIALSRLNEIRPTWSRSKLDELCRQRYYRKGGFQIQHDSSMHGAYLEENA
jgi:hypothetical protein